MFADKDPKPLTHAERIRLQHYRETWKGFQSCRTEDKEALIEAYRHRDANPDSFQSLRSDMVLHLWLRREFSFHTQEHIDESLDAVLRRYVAFRDGNDGDIDPMRPWL